MNSHISYLASPYHSDNPQLMEHRVQAVIEATACLMSDSLVFNTNLVFSPIVYTNELKRMPAVCGWDEADYLNMDLRFLEACSEVLVLCLEGWNNSVGVGVEIARAKELGLPVRYLDPVSFQPIPKPGTSA